MSFLCRLLCMIRTQEQKRSYNVVLRPLTGKMRVALRHTSPTRPSLRLLVRENFIMDFDGALQQVGEFGRYQRKLFFLIAISAFPCSFQMLVLVFTAATPKWICPEDLNVNIKHCKSLEGCCDLDGSVCQGASFITNFTSIATEWSLLCGQTYKNELAQSIFMAGTLIGAPLIGGLADKHGRRKLWLVGYFAAGGFAVLSGFSPSYYVFVALRFVVGIFAGGAGLIIYVLATESIGPSYRGKSFWRGY